MKSGGGKQRVSMCPRCFNSAEFIFVTVYRYFGLRNIYKLMKSWGKKPLVPDTLYKGILRRAGWIEGKVRQSKCEPSHHMELPLHL